MSYEGHIAGEIMLRVTGAISMSRKHRKSFLALWRIAAILFNSAIAQATKKSKPEPLRIQEQGSFAVGGSVTTAPGTFAPIRQGAYNPAGTDPGGADVARRPRLRLLSG